jgi:hypothetical protein
MPTFLEMVNNLFLNLRDDQITSFGDTDRTLAAKKLINEAAREVVNGHEWSFNLREDKVAYFPAAITGTTASVIKNSTIGTLNDATTSSVLYGRDRRTKLMFTDDTEHPNTSYPVADLSVDANQTFTLVDAYRGVTHTSGGFIFYIHELALPADVFQVVSVRNEEGPIQVEFVEKGTQFDAVVPRVTDSLQDRPYKVYVGGTLRTTSIAGTGTAYRTGMMVWPIPSDDVVLKYSYVRRADTLSDEDDELIGVPDEITDIIEWVAFQKALMGNMEDDPRRGNTLFKENEYRIKKAQSRDRPAMMRRKCMMPFVSRGLGRYAYRRWETTEVSGP